MNQNPLEVSQLQPDYLGFIFWEPSARFFEGNMPNVPKSIKKVGVFVDAPLDEVLEKVAPYQLDAVQLHGKESVAYCEELKSNFLSFRAQSRNKKVSDKNEVFSKSFGTLDLTSMEIIKVFSIKDDFDFSILKDYEAVCDYFLFDTKGKLPGGNGYTFDWSILENYPSTKPFFLSGGIGLESVEKLKEFMNSPASTYCYAIDVNSRFETQPGLKNIASLKAFQEALNDHLQLKTNNE